jgi:hypothetical protein
MTKEKKAEVKSIVPPAPPEPVITEAPAAPAAPSEKIAEVDRMALELAKSKREVALAEAKTALANNEKADLAYRYVVLQIYLKYGMTDQDALSEAGDIVRGGAVPRAQ